MRDKKPIGYSDKYHRHNELKGKTYLEFLHDKITAIITADSPVKVYKFKLKPAECDWTRKKRKRRG